MFRGITFGIQIFRMTFRIQTTGVIWSSNVRNDEVSNSNLWSDNIQNSNVWKDDIWNLNVWSGQVGYVSPSAGQPCNLVQPDSWVEPSGTKPATWASA